jgi:transcriptional regulator with XRE-family HTH domain
MAQVFNHALLLKARLELNLTQEEAAAAAGVDVRTYRRYESGAVNDPREGFSVRHPTRRRMIERLSRELGVSEAELLVEGTGAAETSATIQAAPVAANPARAEGSLRPLHAHTLQRARHFQGRGEILQNLLAGWLEEARPNDRVIALVAVGGTGKTAIAERFVTSLGDEPRPGGALVWSFYEDPRTEAFLERAVVYFAPGADVAPGDRLPKLEEALRAGDPHVLVLDGLETVQSEGGAGRAHGELNDALLRRLLFAIARGLGGTRALVTSRFELADLAAWEGSGLRTIRLGGLPPGEAVNLLRAWGIEGGDAALRGLVERAGGHALSLAMLGSYVGAFLAGDPARLDAVNLAAAARDDVLARRLAAVLAQYARALSQEERDLLARLSVFPGGVGEDALLLVIRAGGEIAGSLAGWDVANLRRSLARLERLGLIFSSQPGAPSIQEKSSAIRGYSTHPFLRQYFKSLLLEPPERVWAASTGLPIARLDAIPRSPPKDGPTLDGYEALIGFMLAADRPADADRIYSRALGGFPNLGLALGDMSRGARILRGFAADADPRRMPASLPDGVRASLAYEWGLYTGALGDLAFASRCYEAHNEIAEDMGVPRILATGLRTLAYTERLRGELQAARAHIERSAAVADAGGELEHWARGIALLAAILHDMGEVAAPAAHFQHLRRLGVQPIARRGLWEAERDLALGNRKEARDLTAGNLLECSRLGWEGHVAHCHAVLGLIEVGENEAAAREHLAHARRWASISGEVEMGLRCAELEGRIELSSGRLAEAAKVAAEGLRTSEACGFRLFRLRFSVIAARSELDQKNKNKNRNPRRAAEELARALAEAAPDDAWGRADALHWAGVAWAKAGEGARAKALLKDALALRERLKHPETGATRQALAARKRKP